MTRKIWSFCMVATCLSSSIACAQTTRLRAEATKAWRSYVSSVLEDVSVTGATRYEPGGVFRFEIHNLDRKHTLIRFTYDDGTEERTVMNSRDWFSISRRDATSSFTLDDFGGLDAPGSAIGIHLTYLYSPISIRGFRIDELLQADEVELTSVSESSAGKDFVDVVLTATKARRGAYSKGAVFEATLDPGHSWLVQKSRFRRDVDGFDQHEDTEEQIEYRMIEDMPFPSSRFRRTKLFDMNEKLVQQETEITEFVHEGKCQFGRDDFYTSGYGIPRIELMETTSTIPAWLVSFVVCAVLLVGLLLYQWRQAAS